MTTPNFLRPKLREKRLVSDMEFCHVKGLAALEVNWSLFLKISTTMTSTERRCDDRFWTTTELEQMVQWLKEPSNQSKFKKRSGLTKKSALTQLVGQLPYKTPQQVLDKYGNLKRAYASPPT